MVKPSSIEGINLISNYHYWAILAMTLGLVTFYYGWPWRGWFPLFYDLALFEIKYRIVGILLLIPCFYAAIISRWRGYLIVWVASMAGLLPVLVRVLYEPRIIAINITLLSVPLAITLILALELNWRKKERSILIDRESERQFYVSQILISQENERQRIVREIHDDTIQTLLAVANRAQNLVSDYHSNTGYDVKQNAEWIKDTILGVSKDLRKLSLDLRPGVLDKMGLVPALLWLVNILSEQTNINANLRVEGVERKLPPESEVMIFRIVQEALNNVKHHSKANKAIVSLLFALEFVELKVWDNGVGFDSREIGRLVIKEGKLGLIGMEQRAKSLNGTFHIYSRPNAGVSIVSRFGS